MREMEQNVKWLVRDGLLAGGAEARRSALYARRRHSLENYVMDQRGDLGKAEKPRCEPLAEERCAGSAEQFTPKLLPLSDCFCNLFLLTPGLRMFHPPCPWFVTPFQQISPALPPVPPLPSSCHSLFCSCGYAEPLLPGNTGKGIAQTVLWA